MKLQALWRRWLQELVAPSSSPELEELLENQDHALPTLWLLGKAGSGKSSIVQRLTGDSRVKIGNGFAPCTKTSAYYNHPTDHAALRFLDTRGLGESNYDPTDDIEEASAGSHAVLILTRVDDTSQSELAEVLKSAGAQLDSLAFLHVHTALHAVSGNELARSKKHNEDVITQALGHAPKQVCIDFTDPSDGFEDPNHGLEELKNAIVQLVPELSRVLIKRKAKDQEEKLYLAQRSEILRFASAAAAVDIFPAVGLFAVPATQGKLLHTLAARYGVPWDKKIALEFVTAMGSSFLYRYALALGGRQLAKFIPVYGQSAGAVAASAVSFASTYAIARAACMYLYHKKIHKPISTEALQEAFKQAFNDKNRS